MKIVYVTYEYIDCQSLQIIDGGLANYLHKITTTLHKLGHDVSVIVAPANEDKQINYNGINVIFLTGKFRKTLTHKLIWPFISPKQKSKNTRQFIYTLVVAFKSCIKNRKLILYNTPVIGDLANTQKRKFLLVFVYHHILKYGKSIMASMMPKLLKHNKKSTQILHFYLVLLNI